MTFMLFLVTVVGLAFFGATRTGVGGAIAGATLAVTLWALYGLWWLVDTSYDCSREYDEHWRYTSERCS